MSTKVRLPEFARREVQRGGQRRYRPRPNTVQPVNAAAATVGAAASSSAISGGVTWSPLTGGGGASSVPDLTAPFRYVGIGPESLYLARYGSAFPDYNYVISTHKTATNTVNPTHVVMVEVAGSTAVELKLRTATGGGSYRLRVDGQLLTLAPQAIALVGQVWLPVTLPDTEPHIISLEINQMAWGGVVLGANGIAWRPDAPSDVNALVIGDSYASGTGASGPPGGFARTLGDLMNWAVIESGVGSTGYSVDGTGVRYLTRAANDFHGTRPDIIIVTGGHNDLGQDLGVVQTAVTALAQDLRGEFPNTPIIVVGPWGKNLTATYSDLQAAIFAGWAGYADLLIDTCAGGGWFTGTGNVGATTGTGNCDTMIGSDAVHPTDLGHRYLARRIAEAISRWLDDLTLTSTTAVSANARPVPTATTLTVTGSQVTGTAQKLVAQVTPARMGTMTFKDGATVLAVMPVPDSGTVTLSTTALTAGARSLTATFAPRNAAKAATSTSNTVAWTMFAALSSPITSGLVANFDAATITGLADGAAVSDWAPSGGTETAHLTQATGAVQPTYSAAGMNGHPAVQNASGKGMETAAWGTPVPAACTIIAVHKEGTTTGATQWMLSGASNAGASTERMNVGVTSAGSHCFQQGNQTVQTPSAPAIASSTSAHIIAALFNGASSVLWPGQYTKPTEVRSFGTSAFDGLQGLRVGDIISASGYGTNPFTGAISAVLVYNRVLSDGEVKQTLNLLASRYGITLGA